MQRKSGPFIPLLFIALTTLSCSSQKAPPAEQPLTDCEVTMASELGLTAVDATLICGFVDGKNAQYEPLRALADWVNQPPDPQGNPFSEAAISQLVAEMGSQEAYKDWDISSATRMALGQLGHKSAEEIQKVDLEDFAESDELFDAFHDMVYQGLLNADYAGISTSAYNPWCDLDLLIDGVKLSTLPAAPAPTPRKFCLWIPLYQDGTEFVDQNRFVDVSTDGPTNTSGHKAYRYQQPVEVTRGQTKNISSLSPSAAPALSIAVFGARAATGTPVVMAGDTVQLQVESPAEAALTDDVVWIELGSKPTSSIEPSDIINASGGSKATVGLLAWTELRELVVQDELQRSKGMMGSGLLSGQTKSERIIGYGPKVSWTPQSESPDVQIVVLARNQNGLWGIAKRPTPVIDLRPAVWAKPLVHVEIASGSDFASTEEPWTLAKHVQSVQNFLDLLTFQPTAGQQVSIDLPSTPFSEAHVPIQMIQVAYGDGGSSSFVAGAMPSRVQHTWKTPGVYDLTVTATGVDGLDRTMTSKVNVQPAKPNEAPVAAKAKENRPAPSAADLFGEAVGIWAQEVVRRVNDQMASTPELEISHIHSRLQRPVVDLFDAELVQELMRSGNTIYDRDRVFNEAVSNYGALDPTPVFGGPKTLKMHQILPLLHRDTQISEENLRIAMELYDEAHGTPNATTAETSETHYVLAYKLHTAGTQIKDARNGLAVRNAKVSGHIRIHNPATHEIIFADDVSASVSDLISKPTIKMGNWESWNERPSEWMLDLRPDTDWESAPNE